MQSRNAHTKKLPIVAIVGRPNVGKSTLFNCLSRKRKALVYDQPGVTRDRQYIETTLNGRRILLVDTGGLLSEMEQGSDIDRGVVKQVKEAIREADCIVAVFDGRADLTAADREVVKVLRPFGKPVIYVVNKIDTDKQKNAVASFFELGISAPLAVAAEHRRGMDCLEEAIAEALPVAAEVGTEDQNLIRLAIIGRPNVGKSSLLNTLIGGERTVVSATAGTTRDSIDVAFYEGRQGYLFVDTAGVRQKSKTDGIEGLSVIKALQSIRDAHIVILVIDLSRGITDQDRKIAGLAEREGRGILIFGNKLDLLARNEKRLSQTDWDKLVHERIPFLSFAPVICGSALKGKFPRERFFSLIERMERARHKEIPTGELNRFFEEILRTRNLPLRGGKRFKVYYVTQALAHSELRGIRPSTPHFVCFVNEPKAVATADERYLINCLRKRYKFFGNPIVLEFRLRQNKPQALTKS